MTKWLDYCLACHRTGSRVICDPPVMDTDDDYICLLDPESIPSFEGYLKKEGFTVGGSGAGLEALLEPTSLDDYYFYYSDKKFWVD